MATEPTEARPRTTRRTARRRRVGAAVFGARSSGELTRARAAGSASVNITGTSAGPGSTRLAWRSRAEPINPMVAGAQRLRIRVDPGPAFQLFQGQPGS